ncbi:hypothetical protein D3C85_1266640 [compost metagenome]
MREIKFPDIRGVVGVNDAQIINGRIIFKLRVGIFNASQLQNEYDVSFKLMLIGATFGERGPHPVHTYSMQNRLVQSNLRREPLYYGMPYTASFWITAATNAKQIKILLSFGGKKSPAKTSDYIINVDVDNLQNFNKQIEAINENEPFKEIKTIDENLAFFKENNI